MVIIEFLKKNGRVWVGPSKKRSLESILDELERRGFAPIVQLNTEGNIRWTTITMRMNTTIGVKLYIDDERQLPEPYAKAGYRLIRSAEVAIGIINIFGLKNITHISFDHDLGEGVMSGYDVVKYVEERVIAHGDPMPEMDVHSQNPPGAKNIMAAIQAMRRFTDQKGIANSSN